MPLQILLKLRNTYSLSNPDIDNVQVKCDQETTHSPSDDTTHIYSPSLQFITSLWEWMSISKSFDTANGFR